MKITIATATMILLLGTSASAYAQQGKGNEGHSQAGHSQAARPAQTQSRPAQQQRQSRPAAKQQTRTARPAQQQHTQQAARTQQRPQTHAVNRSQQGNSGRSQARTQQTRAEGGNRGNYAHGRISDARYASNFGSGHSFHVNRGDYDRRRFEYGGYSFGFIDPWPMGWGHSDDVYVIYDDGGYFMYDRFHPGFRISVNIL
jgi:hypothetical protein